jgi:catechol 2,3-dioxygenase-like lactoylglutathione lyase family enzyme
VSQEEVAAVLLLQNGRSSVSVVQQYPCRHWMRRLIAGKVNCMVPTYGLTHINLAVRDTERALRFYEQVFGLREYGRGDGLVHTQAAGRRDILTFTEDPSTAGVVGGVAHFGFRLVDPNDIDRAITEVKRAGGRLLRRGEFAPGLPYAYIADPDGYEIEIWFE